MAAADSAGKAFVRTKTVTAHNAAFTIDIRGRQGDRSVRPHFQTVRVRAVVATAEPIPELAAVIEETEARCPVMNLLLDAKVDLRVEWARDSVGTLETIPRGRARHGG